MTYAFIPAAAQYGTRKGPVMAFVVHMAEGGGTVSFLSKPNPRNVSVHYVIEYSGRIVQMVRESDATGSINPADLRTTDDPAVYGATIRKAVMGAWDHDPNSAIITTEIEGFAMAGPNATQRASLKLLVEDVRSRYPTMGLLGHRDFQDYKPCPGKLIAWPDLGGHGLWEVDVAEIVPFAAPIPFEVVPATTRSFSATAPYPELGAVSGSVLVDATVFITGTGTPHGAFVRIVTGPAGARLVAAAAVMPSGPSMPDCTQAIADAKAAEHELVRTLAVAAVSAL